ncbi:MAG: hypothetical protein IJ746_03275 [Ruminococcus sp.]|nr:hypothetical protein [Ruminococcus sp.]
MKKLLALAAAALLLTACAEAPENVKNNSGSGNAPVSENGGEIEYIPQSELEADAQTALSRSYSNFSIADTVRVELPAEIVACDFTVRSGFSERGREVLERFFGRETIEKVGLEYEPATPIENGDYSRPACWFFYSEEEKAYGSVHDNGFVAFIKPELFEDSFDGGRNMGVYHIDRGGDFSDSFPLEGGGTTVQEAADFAGRWVDENYRDLEPDYELSVKTVMARQNTEGEYSFDIIVQKLYKGLPLDELLTVLENDEAGGPSESETYLKYVTQSLKLRMKKRGEIGAFTTGYGTLLPTDRGAPERLVSLTSAMGFLEHTFTDFNEPMTINDINLKYTMTPEYDYRNRQPEDDCGVKWAGRLQWEFVIDIDKGDYPYQEGNSDVGDVRKYIYIDAETGELEFEFDLNRLRQ